MRRFAIILFIFAVLGIAGFGVLTMRRAADASSLDKIIVEEAPPQPKAPEAPRPLDPRLRGLSERADGARLAWQPAEGETLLRAGFIDNGAMVLTATSIADFRVFAYDLHARIAAERLAGPEERYASGRHPAHKNADKLCWSERDARGIFEVWCANYAGQSPKPLTSHDGREDLIEPAISPDGGWVAFEVNTDRSSKKDKPQGSTIWKIGLNGSGIQQLTRGADDRFPAWADDGRKIVFQRRSSAGHWDIYVMDADGKNPSPILRTPEEDELWPLRRPASDEMLFSEISGEAPARLKVIDAATKAGAYPTSGAYGPETFPSVTPDGKIASFLAPVPAEGGSASGGDPEHPERLGVWLISLEEIDP